MKKNNVFLEIVHAEFKDGKFNADVEKTPCGHLSNDAIVEYHNKLIHAPIPADSCIYNLHTTFIEKTTTNALSSEQPKDYEQEKQYELTLEFCNPQNNAKCDVCYNHLASCSANIRAGLCRDLFMIEKFCKILFPERYKHFNQRR